MIDLNNFFVIGTLYGSTIQISELFQFLSPPCVTSVVKSQGDDDILDSLEDIQSADVCRETARFEHSYPQNRTSAGVIRLLHERNGR